MIDPSGDSSSPTIAKTIQPGTPLLAVCARTRALTPPQCEMRVRSDDHDWAGKAFGVESHSKLKAFVQGARWNSLFNAPVNRRSSESDYQGLVAPRPTR